MFDFRLISLDYITNYEQELQFLQICNDFSVFKFVINDLPEAYLHVRLIILEGYVKENVERCLVKTNKDAPLSMRLRTFQSLSTKLHVGDKHGNQF